MALEWVSQGVEEGGGGLGLNMLSRILNVSVYSSSFSLFLNSRLTVQIKI